MPSINDPFAAQQRRAATQAQHRQNSTRAATSRVVVTSTGKGELRLADRIDFGLAFLSKPHISHGWVLPDDGDSLVAGFYPRVAAGVLTWDVDKISGLYRGCWLVVTVDVPADDGSAPSYVIDHHLTFTGVAIKDVPINLLRGV